MAPFTKGFGEDMIGQYHIDTSTLLAISCIDEAFSIISWLIVLFLLVFIWLGIDIVIVFNTIVMLQEKIIKKF